MSMTIPVKGFEDLRIWQAAHALALQIYQVTAGFPGSELYGLTNQIRRASSSVAANIAEGYGRFSRSEYMHFIYVARGSLMETKSFVYLARDMGYLGAEAAKGLLNDIDALGVKLNNTVAAMKKAQSTKPREAGASPEAPKERLSTMKHHQAQ